MNSNVDDESVQEKLVFNVVRKKKLQGKEEFEKYKPNKNTEIDSKSDILVEDNINIPLIQKKSE